MAGKRRVFLRGHDSIYKITSSLSDRASVIGIDTIMLDGPNPNCIDGRKTTYDCITSHNFPLPQTRLITGNDIGEYIQLGLEREQQSAIQSKGVNCGLFRYLPA